VKNPVIDIRPTNQSMPETWRGMVYDFKNGWSLSVHLTKRGNTHECALLKPEGGIAEGVNADSGGDPDLLFLTSEQVARLVDDIQRDVVYRDDHDTFDVVQSFLLLVRRARD